MLGRELLILFVQSEGCDKSGCISFLRYLTHADYGTDT